MPYGSTPRSQAETLSILTDLVQRHEDNFAKHNQQMESMQQSIKDLQISMAKLEKIPALLPTPALPPMANHPYYYPHYQHRAEISYFTGEDVAQWLSQVESLFYRHQTASGQKLAVGTFYLAGDALEWYRQWYWDMRRSWRSLTWDNFAADLRCRF
ncbi:unnamed protein product [Rhodiola kirilowii]